MTKQFNLTRRQCLAACSAGALVIGLGAPRHAAAAETIRQGYQTNIWGMPTYYLMKSGYLEKHGLAAEEFAVLGCRFEHARCLELLGDRAAARAEYERLGALPALARVGV